ncbi:MAG: hypothetical protein ACSHWY_12030 [Octadecabacter sp.]
MFRFFENLIDPCEAYRQGDALPTRIWPFVMAYARPFTRVFWAAGLYYCGHYAGVWARQSGGFIGTQTGVAE